MTNLILAVPSYIHIIIVIAIILLLFGGKKLPELARGLARGLRIFRDEMQGVKSNVEDAAKLPPTETKDDAGTRGHGDDDAPKA